ncbi:shikimate kinase [Microscilla marina]|uniref:Shikimate kinase n=1 Tax=Microscilla marina ATCC 23134 TaxID=313606 RepID=A1ZT38_MICM2|nr:shikimate kinase [Microscilla marina]EAY26428.1 shikimate kinase [Microscilla marina ATCC 23134]
MLIFLIGMPGSGKSSVGKQLASEWQIPFVDMDELIEQKAQKSIPTIFEQDGEAHFRRLEQAVLHEIIAQPPTTQVIATGGGAPCFFDNMDRINRAGTSVFIDTPLYTIAQRMTNKSQDRPLYQQADYDAMYQKLVHTFGQRKQFYWQANIFLSATELSVPS